MPFSLNNTMDEYTRPKTSLKTNLINSQIPGSSDPLSPMNGPSKDVGTILTLAPEPEWVILSGATFSLPELTRPVRSPHQADAPPQGAWQIHFHRYEHANQGMRGSPLC